MTDQQQRVNNASDLIERLKAGQDLLRLFVSSWNPRQSGKTSAGQLIIDIDEAIQALQAQQKPVDSELVGRLKEAYQNAFEHYGDHYKNLVVEIDMSDLHEAITALQQSKQDNGELERVIRYRDAIRILIHKNQSTRGW